MMTKPSKLSKASLFNVEEKPLAVMRVSFIESAVNRFD
jgi:hypothetical protein